MITKNNEDFQIETDYEGKDEFKLPCQNIYDAVRIYGRVLDCQIKERNKSIFTVFLILLKSTLSRV